MKMFASLTLALFVLLHSLARADHGPPTAADVDELVGQYADRIDELAEEYGFELGELPTFDEPFFNRLLGHARVLVERTRTSLDHGDFCRATIWLYHSVRVLDRATNFGIAANMSGFGHSDDLASLTRARVEFFLEDLIVLAAAEGVPPHVLMIAAALEEAGDALNAPGDEGQLGALRPLLHGGSLPHRALPVRSPHQALFPCQPASGHAFERP